MATWMIHLRIADALLDLLPGLDDTAFVVGNLAPDSGIPNDDWSAFTPPKTLSHFKTTQDGRRFTDTARFCAEYLCAEKLCGYSARAKSFYLGYLAHLLTDIAWVQNMRNPALARCSALSAADAAVQMQQWKRDWCDGDFLFLDAHPRFRAFCIYEAASGFKNDLMSMFARDAFESRRAYISAFYRSAHGGLCRESLQWTAEQGDEFVHQTAEQVSARLLPFAYTAIQ